MFALVCVFYVLIVLQIGLSYGKNTFENKTIYIWISSNCMKTGPIREVVVHSCFIFWMMMMIMMATDHIDDGLPLQLIGFL